MLRSLYSGISGLRAHQTMLDVTGNNIANVNTPGFKASSVRFEDTLSQTLQGANAPAAGQGGTNPAQVGLGVQTAAISVDFTPGSRQTTGRGLDLAISGDGFFVVQDGTGNQLYTRDGALDFDGAGRLVTSEGAIVLGWPAVNGVVDTQAPLGPVTLPATATSPARATDAATMGGNLPADAAVGTALSYDVTVYDGLGQARTLTMTFTRTAAGWDVSGADGSATATGAITFDADGQLASGGTLAVGGVSVDLSGLTGFAQLQTVKFTNQNGFEPGTLQSYSLGSDGSLVGSFSNGTTQVLGQIAVATFTNPAGLEKVGGSTYRPTLNSGALNLEVAGTAGAGAIVPGSLEMSNVDLSKEFTNLIVAQRGFQANARVITTSDEVLQELTNLKR